MKRLFRLLFFALLVFLGYKYVQNNKAQVMGWIDQGREWLGEKAEEIQEDLAERGEESANPDTGTGSDQLSSSSPMQSDTEDSHQSDSRSHNSGNSAQIVNSRTRTSGGSGRSEYDGSQRSIREASNSSFKKLGEGLPADDVGWVKAVSQKYSPGSWYMLMQYEGLPGYSEAPLQNGGTASSNKPVQTFHYLEGKDRSELLSSMETNVHELAHAYFGQNCYRYANENDLMLDWDKAEGFIYISPSEHYFVSVPKEILFPSRRLSSVIPFQLRTFRYDTYIEGNTSTQGDGVVGLLNELHAYYLGSKYCYDMLDAYQNAKASDATGFLEWVRHSMSSMTAYWEFDYFVREYLLYMKEHAPEDYRELRSNREFMRAYAAVAAAYEKLTKDYYQKVISEMERLNASGIADVSLEEGRLWVKLSGSYSRSGSPVFSADRERLLAVLESGRYREIDL